MNQSKNLFFIALIFLISVITIIIEFNTSFSGRLSSFLFLQFVYSLFLNIFLLKFIFSFEVITHFFNRFNIFIQYFIYIILFISSIFIIVNLDFSIGPLVGQLIALVFLFTFSFLTQLLIYETLSKIYKQNSLFIYFSAATMFILFIILLSPLYI